jgi:urease accessory protein
LTEGIAEIGFAQSGGRSRLAHLYQRDPLRVLFPTPAVGDSPLAVIVTTSGGLVAGDRLEVAVRIGAGAAAHVTASAAEKIYRSTGRTTTIRQTLSLEAGAVLEFLPPETILFDGARLERKTVVKLEPGGVFLGGDIVVFGRRARGERFTRGYLRELWEVWRHGKLTWGDALNLDDDVSRIIQDSACFDGAAAFATMIVSLPRRDSRGFLESARAFQSATPTIGLRAGVTAIEGLMIARWLAMDAADLRHAYTRFACYLRSAVLGLPPLLPRLWQA